MSGRVVGRVFERVVGSAIEKAVLVCLAEHSNPDGEMSFPSAKRIAMETEFSERAVRAALSSLRRRGLIVQTAGASQHRPATYRVDLRVVSDLHLVQVYAEPDLHLVPSRPAPGAPEPSINLPKVGIGETPIPPGPTRTRAEEDDARKRIETLFSKLSGLPRPDPKTDREKREAGQLWYAPIRETLELAAWDVETAQKWTTRAYAELRGRRPPLTISDFNSILKTVRSLAAQDSLAEPTSDRWYRETFGHDPR